ncbi:MAG: hypothetical protein ACP5MH_07220, partial [Thermoproteus sp.]
NLKTLGFEIRPSDRALLETVEKQAYQRGVEDGRRQAEIFGQVAQKAIEAALGLLSLFTSKRGLPLAPPPPAPQQAAQAAVQTAQQAAETAQKVIPAV